jgi:hypothetical protein
MRVGVLSDCAVQYDQDLRYRAIIDDQKRERERAERDMRTKEMELKRNRKQANQETNDLMIGVGSIKTCLSNLLLIHNT